jgi:2-oxoglutarate dehydrogenase E2 component (dihydrolipoamide succinyltransferase)
LTDVAVRARAKKLSPDDIVNGTFSITNYGIFGSIIGTPIINQPQAAILGLGAIKKRPMVLSDDAGNDVIDIRSMIYLTLTFDHRIIDGAIGGQCLSRIKWLLEHFNFQLVLK